ncbi:MAG: FAD-binding oxidoreductase, partial [Chloroflexi bacterium]|nr:FAD-binding oxidoreductase [Chloroflexota bacterium]
MSSVTQSKSPATIPPVVSMSEVESLEVELRSKLQGEVRFDDGSRALYSTDASNYRQVPVGVVIPKSIEDVVSAISACHRRGVPVLARGGGTSLAGQCCNLAVVIDFSKYLNKVIEVDAEKKIARVQPGVILDDLRDAAEKYNLTYGPDPATHNRCTLGGMIGNNSCGVHSVIAGMTSDNVEELEIVTYDGLRLRVGRTSEEDLALIIRQGGRRAAIYARLKALRDRYSEQIRERYPDIPRRVSGYNLPALLPEAGFNVASALVGSECTCVTVLEAVVRLVNSPPARTLLVLGYPDIYHACDHIPEIIAHKPIGLEGFDDRLINGMKKEKLLPDDVALLPDGGGWLLAEFGSQSKDDANRQVRGLMEALKGKGDAPVMKLFDDSRQAERIWRVREAALGATAKVPGEKDEWPGWEDSAVPPDRMGDYLRDLRKLLDKYGYACAFYGHFGQGCVHTRIDFDLHTEPGVASFRRFMSDAVDLVLSYGGSLSGEHGDGQSRAEFLPRMFGEELMHAFRDFKAIWDPDWKMNPGKVIDPYRVDENLRLGPDYNPARPLTHFNFIEDGGSFARATQRCVGVGECRRLAGGTMCPSFMVTREEEDSTRGRARLLFEMLRGEVISEGWRSEHVKDALDLCLACKGCKGDCPVNVDMATYKSEFLSHYYAGRLRPVSAYTMGLIYWWARLASHMPRAVNSLTHAPLLSNISKALGGIARQRTVPRFAEQTFKEWFKERSTLQDGYWASALDGDQNRPRVILWPDTFNNHFHPEIAMSAFEVLQAAGYSVAVPQRPLCCGRPLYDWGMLNLAEHMLTEIL